MKKRFILIFMIPVFAFCFLMCEKDDENPPYPVNLTVADIELDGSVFQVRSCFANPGEDSTEHMLILTRIWYGDGGTCASYYGYLIKVPPSNWAEFKPTFKHFYPDTGIYRVKAETIIYFPLISSEDSITDSLEKDFHITY